MKKTNYNTKENISNEPLKFEHIMKFSNQQNNSFALSQYTYSGVVNDLDKLNLDENDPLFIPKKGIFYQHDTRIHRHKPPVLNDLNIVKEKPVVQQKLSRSSTKMKLNEEWKHDMFDVSNQLPKTSNDIINKYGYDIRNDARISAKNSSLKQSTKYSNPRMRTNTNKW